MPTRTFAPSIILVLAAQTAIAGDSWPGWRGPGGMGQTDDTNLPLTWGGKAGDNVLWKASLFPSDKVRRDQNQSSPAVWGERVFVTVSYWPKGVSEKEYPEHHVICFGARDGAKLWDVTVQPGPWRLTDLRGGYTAPTPACDDQRVYVVFGSAVIAALGHDGKPAWRKEVAPYDFDVAIGSSPVLFEDCVLFVSDLLQGKKSSSITAFERSTGAIRWQAKRPDVDWSHSTPALARIGGKTQLLVATSMGPQGLDPKNGDRLWWCNVPGGRVGDTVTPVLAKNLLYIDSGRGGPGVAVDPTGQGDVSKTHVRWKIASVPEGFSSPIIVGEHLYRLHSPGVLKSFRLADGTEAQRERLEGIDPAVSPIATPNGLIYCASAGTSYVIKAGSKFEVLARNDLGDPSHAAPATAAGRIYLKGSRILWCVGKK